MTAASAGAGRLCTYGTRSVRSVCSTSVCVQSDSTNQPVWKTAAKAAMPATSPDAVSSAQGAPVTAGATTKNSAANVRRSKTELVGPIQSMKPTMERASQRRGRARNSSSMRSQGIAAHESV